MYTSLTSEEKQYFIDKMEEQNIDKGTMQIIKEQLKSQEEIEDSFKAKTEIKKEENNIVFIFTAKDLFELKVRFLNFYKHSEEKDQFGLRMIPYSEFEEDSINFEIELKDGDFTFKLDNLDFLRDRGYLTSKISTFINSSLIDIRKNKIILIDIYEITREDILNLRDEVLYCFK